jgi:hypothetical protein
VGLLGWGLAQEIGGQDGEGFEVVVGVGALAEAVGGVEERDVAVAGGGLVAGGVADEDRVAKLVAIDQHTEVLRLGEAGVAPALEVAKAATLVSHKVPSRSKTTASITVSLA